MFAFADPHSLRSLTGPLGPPRLDKLDLDLDIAAGRGLRRLMAQSTQIGAVTLAAQPAGRRVVSAAITSLRKARRRIWTARA